MMCRWVQRAGWGIVDRPLEGDHGGTAYVAPLGDGTISVLGGPVAAVLRCALQAQDLADVARLVATQLGVTADDVDLDVTREVVDELVDLGVLTEKTS